MQKKQKNNVGLAPYVSRVIYYIYCMRFIVWGTCNSNKTLDKQIMHMNDVNTEVLDT